MKIDCIVCEINGLTYLLHLLDGPSKRSVLLMPTSVYALVNE